jgi:DNA-binding NarL/FixJ family response regulator
MEEPTAAAGPSDGGSPPPESVPVLLVDDHAIWRGGVRSMLEDTEFVVVGEAEDGPEALEKVEALHPRLVLLDIRMSSDDGLDALQALKSKHPDTAVVMLTTYENPTYLARAVASGAAGYLLKGIKRDALLQSLRAVAHGDLLVSHDELVHSLRDVSQRTMASARTPDTVQPLTNREQEVLRLLATGLSNREIAAVLLVAESTITTHVKHIIVKLGVSDRVQAAVWAARHGLADNPP